MVTKPQYTRPIYTKRNVKRMSKKELPNRSVFWKAKRELIEGARRRTIAISRRWNKYGFGIKDLRVSD